MPRTDSALTGVLIQENDGNGHITLGSCAGSPGSLATTASKFAVGCVLVDTTSGKAYSNVGTVALPSWIPVANRGTITVSAKTTSTTLTAAELLGGIITSNQGAGAGATYTLPTGVLLQAALPAGFATGDSFEFSVTNVSTVAAEDATVQGGVGTTLLGSGAVASNAAATDKSAGTFRVVKSGNETFNIYRVG